VTTAEIKGKGGGTMAQQLKGKEWNLQDPRTTTPNSSMGEEIAGSNWKNVDIWLGDVWLEGEENECVVQLVGMEGEDDLLVHHMQRGERGKG
jgi:hypothetical protein